MRPLLEPRFSLGALAWASLAASIACSSTSEERPPERLENASAALVEADITAVLDGSSTELAFPLSRKTAGLLRGELTVRLVDISDDAQPVLAEATVDLDQTEAFAEHHVRLAGLPAGLTRPDTAALVLDWSIDVPAGQLYGRRALYAALGKLEVQVRGSTEVRSDAPAALRVITRDATTGAPVTAAVQAVALDAEGQPDSILAQGTTDARGELLLEVALSGTELTQRVRLEVASETASTWTETVLKRVGDARVALSSDKTIYKPGQSIHLRALAVRSTDKSPLGAQPIHFEALDGKGNKVFKKTVDSDAFGVASVEVPTDVRVNEGDWTFRAAIADTQTDLKLPVAQYNLPKLKVSVEAGAGFALAGQPLSGTVSAHYLFGLPVTGAGVSVSARLPDGSLVAQTQGQTDADGALAYALSLPSSATGLEDGTTLEVTATVTDAAGQTEAGAAALPFVKDPLVVRALPEAGALVPDADNAVWIAVTDPLGRPVVADVDVNGTTVTTEASGLTSVTVRPLAGETTHALAVRAEDGAQRVASRAFALDVLGADTLLVSTPRATWAPGETAQVVLQGSSELERAFVSVFRGTALERSLELDLDAGRGTFELPLAADASGIYVVDAFALGESGEVVSGSQRLFVPGDDELSIRLSTDAQTYAPGAEASVTVEVTDAAGNPAVASVGLSAVDEAVFALGGEPDDDLRAWLGLPSGVFASDAFALGRSPSDLFGALGATELEETARILFAGSAGRASPAFDYNSIREERPAVRAAYTSAVDQDLFSVLARLVASPNKNRISESTADALVLPIARGMVDPFGQPYTAYLSPEYWGNLVMVSSGPDEIAGTDDDVSVNSYYEHVRWVDDEEELKGWGAGGGWLEGGVAVDAAAGAPNQRADDAPSGSGSGAGETKVRADFRETILYRPQLVTDTNGRAQLSFPLADSITTWRVSAQASSMAGELGSAKTSFRTFQRFFVDFDVPTTLTMGDEVELSVVVYNYLDEAQTVSVQLADAPWMTVLGGSEQSVQLGASEVRSVPFRVRVDTAGDHTLSLSARAGDVSDALERSARVMPSGTKVDESKSGQLESAASETFSFDIPADAVAGGTHLELALTPGFAAQAVEGMEALVKEPTGCFEQTTSSAWPNTMVATYLETTGQMTPELREEIIGVVTRGYQRLLTFESPTGGFNWWGDSEPGNRILSAIFLWHLNDLSGLIEVDDAVRQRTLKWLLDQQQADGHWASGDQLHSGNEVLGTSDARTTAFITWALAHTDWAPDAVRAGTTWLGGHLPETTDLYANALVANALARAEPNGTVTAQVLNRVDAIKELDEAQRAYWPTEAPSWTGAGGASAAIETTGLVAYGFMQAQAHPESVNGAMRYLVANKDAVGTWYNTQATMNALRALLAAASPRGSDAEGQLVVEVDGQVAQTIPVRQVDGDLLQTFDLTPYAGTGSHALRVSFTGSGKLSYRVTRTVYAPAQAPANSDALALTVGFDRTSVQVGERVNAEVTVRYLGQGQQDQVMARIGVPPGFTPDADALATLVSDGRAARVERSATHVDFYLMGMQSGQARDLSFPMVAGVAGAVESPASSSYVYYEPSVRTEAPGAQFVVSSL